MRSVSCLLAIVTAMIACSANAQQVLVEAERFDSHGEFKLDTQFVDIPADWRREPLGLREKPARNETQA